MEKKKETIYDIWREYLNINEDYLEISKRLSGKDYPLRFLKLLPNFMTRDRNKVNKTVGDLEIIAKEMIDLCHDKPIQVVKSCISRYLYLEVRNMLSESFMVDVMLRGALKRFIGELPSPSLIGPGRIREKELEKYLAVYKLKQNENKQWKEIIKIIDDGLYRRILDGRVMLESARRDYQNYLAKAKNIKNNSVNGKFPGIY